MNTTATCDWLPDYIDVASLPIVMERVRNVLNEGFVPECLLDKRKFYPFTQWDQVEFGVNDYALVSAVGNALKDIQRWAAFHLTKPSPGKKARPDRHKYAGFLGKWIAKERPIYIRLNNPDQPVPITSDMYLINAWFAVAVMRAYLDNDMDPILEHELTYILHFREEKGETLALLAYCAERLGVAPSSYSYEQAASG
jgi:hypothetical protein